MYVIPVFHLCSDAQYAICLNSFERFDKLPLHGVIFVEFTVIVLHFLVCAVVILIHTFVHTPLPKPTFIATFVDYHCILHIEPSL